MIDIREIKVDENEKETWREDELQSVLKMGARMLDVVVPCFIWA